MTELPIVLSKSMPKEVKEELSLRVEGVKPSKRVLLVNNGGHKPKTNSSMTPSILLVVIGHDNNTVFANFMAVRKDWRKDLPTTKKNELQLVLYGRQFGIWQLL